MTSERRDGPTPAGGAYSVAVWMDERGEVAAKDAATHCVVTEYTAEGKWLAETVAVLYDHVPGRVYGRPE